MSKPKGVVAAGHEQTARAAEQLLREGANAFDAALAAVATACVAEPVLCTPGGGGFALCVPAQGKPCVYDCFVQTPLSKRDASELDFRSKLADFGTATQEFHIGFGASATPGIVRGLFDMHADLGTVPLPEIFAPAVRLAADGVRVSSFQAYLFEVVGAIFASTRESLAIFGSRENRGKLVGEGELLRQPELADMLENLAIEGAGLFYRGEIAQRIARDMREGGGHLSLEDLTRYEVVRRTPLTWNHAGARVLTNPPPSSGGVLAAFGLAMLQDAGLARAAFGSSAHVGLVAEALAATHTARVDAHAKGEGAETDDLLAPELLDRYRADVLGRARAHRGTTHVSVIDAAGNLASVTVSNGEGSGYVVPGTGIVMNNMLGEEDLNPGGFHRWRVGERMTSMMMPTAVQWPDGRALAAGSGGSNRIRSAMLQVLVNVLDFGLDLEAAVNAPRIHLEGERLSVEGGHDPQRLGSVLERFPSHQIWKERNLFFGGVHTVARTGGSLYGTGDARRNGVCIIC